MKNIENVVFDFGNVLCRYDPDYMISRFLSDPDDIGAITCYLASPEARYMTGSVNTVDGGWTCGYTKDF